MTKAEFWRGGVLLVRDGVVAGSQAVESIQKELANRVFKAIILVPGLSKPAGAVQSILDVSMGIVHGAIRVASNAVAEAMTACIEKLDTAYGQ